MESQELETIEEPVICRREKESGDVIVVMAANVAGPHQMECFATQIAGNENSYTFTACDYQTILGISDPIEDAEESKEVQNVLEKARVKYNAAGCDPKFKFYQKRTTMLRRAFQEKHREYYSR